MSFPDTPFISKVTNITSNWLNAVNDFCVQVGTSVGSSLIGFIQSGIDAVSRTVQDKLRDDLHIKDFGGVCDGIADDTLAFQNLFAEAEATGKPAHLFGTPKITSGLTYNFQKFTIEGNGATIDATAVVGYALTLVGGAVSDDTLNTAAGRNAMRNLNILLPNRGVGHNGLFFGDSSGTTLSGCLVTIENVTIDGGDKQISFGNNAFMIDFTNCRFSHALENIRYPSGLTNSGENIAFSHCRFFNSTANINAAGGNLAFFGCSFDYFDTYAANATSAASVSIINSHIETNTDGDYWAKTSGSASVVNIRDSVIFVTGARTKELFQGGTGDGGVNLDGIFIGSTPSAEAGYTPQFLGTGFVFQNGRFLWQSPANVFRSKPTSALSGLLMDPGFTLSTFRTLRNDIYAYQNQNGISYDSGSLKISPATGSSSALRRYVMCGPSSQVYLSYDIRNTIGNATDSLTISINTFDQAGNQTQSARTVTYNQGNQFASLSTKTLIQDVCPAGTAYALITITTNASAVDGTTAHWLDNFHVSVKQGEMPSIQFGGSNSETAGFVPVVFGSTSAGTGTYTNQSGRFNVIGNLCFFHMEVTWTAHTGTGSLRIDGLPFIQSPSTTETYALAASGFAFTGPVIHAVGLANTNKIFINQVATTGVSSSVTIPGAGTMKISGFYRISGS